MATRFQATVTVPASPQRAFDLLTNPARDNEFDATGMVGPPASPARLTRADQVFVMNMTYRSSPDHLGGNAYIRDLLRWRSSATTDSR